jgi:putative NADH-flavin reductase
MQEHGRKKMKVALIGGTGQSGRRILTELLDRGHSVTAMVRDPAKLQAHAGFTAVQGDVNDEESIVAASRGADALVSAYGPGPEHAELLVPATEHLLAAAKASGVPRFIYVGGAGALEVAPGVTLIGSGHVPAEWLPIAQAHADALEVVRKSDVNWTSVAPSAYFEAGERTGKFRLAKDSLIMDENQQSRISFEDLAIALVDELESPKHERQRFTVGY